MQWKCNTSSCHRTSFTANMKISSFMQFHLKQNFMLYKDKNSFNSYRTISRHRFKIQSFVSLEFIPVPFDVTSIYCLDVPENAIQFLKLVKMF